MQTNFEHLALGSMLGQSDMPPKDNGTLYFTRSLGTAGFWNGTCACQTGGFELGTFARR